MPTPMQSTPAPTFESGANVADTAALLTWLRQQAKDGQDRRRLFRVPVVIRFDSPGKLMIDDAAIGVDAAALGADGLHVELDDTTMSVALMDHCRRLCPPKDDVCGLWIHAQVGRALPMPNLPPIPGAPPEAAETLSVRAVEGLIEAGAKAAATKVGVAR